MEDISDVKLSVKIVFVSLAVAVVFFLCRPAMRSGFTFDDSNIITNNRDVQIGFVNAMFRSPFRALTVATYRLDYLINRELNPAQFHLTSIVLHMLAALSLGLFWRRASLWAGMSAGAAWWAGALSGLLFGIHPLNFEAAAYISARGNVIGAILVFLGLNFCFKSLENGFSIKWHIAGFLCISAALFSNEAAVAGPALAVCVYFLVSARKPGAATPKYKFRESLMFIAPYLFLATVWVAARLSHRIDSGLVVPGLDMKRTWATPIWAVGEYTRMALFPYGMSIDHGAGTESVFKNGIAAVFIAILLILLCFFSAYRLFKGSDRVKAMAAFAVLWWLICLAPVAAAPLMDAVAERRAYLAMGAIGFAPALFMFLKVTGWKWAKSGIWAMTLLIFLFGTLTASYASTWKKPAHIWENAVRRTPGNTRAWGWLGNTYLHSENNLKSAKKALKIALSLAPDSFKPEVDLGIIAEREGNIDEAVWWFQEALRKDPKDWLALVDLGVMLTTKGDYQTAIKYITMALTISSNDPSAWFNWFSLGNAQLGAKMYEEAEGSYRKAISGNQRYVAARVSLAQTLDESGRSAEALKEIATALEITPDFTLALQLGAIAARHAGNLELAASYWRKYLKLNDNDGRAWADLADVLKKQGLEAEANAATAKAQNLGVY